MKYLTVNNASTPRRKDKWKDRRKGKTLKAKSPTSAWAIDVLIGDEEQNGKPEITKRKNQGAGHQPSYPGQ